MTNLIGQSLGRYHILERLGEGGMATVYKAYDTRLERDVAIKIIRKAAFPPEQLDRILRRFEREAKALAKLSHPNIVNVLDYGEYEGSPYLVMVFLPSGTLKQILGKPIPWQEATRLLLPIARALEFAHKQGIIHRDIKPSNILITLSGEPILSDFGIAKILEQGESATLTGTGIGVGTPEYMAPEQWTGSATAQSDIYSLGVVYYEMITGRKPYTADTPAAILLKQNNEPLPRPSKYVPGLPDKVERVLFKALARDRKDRYPDMAAFATALDIFQRDANQIPQPSLTKKDSPPAERPFKQKASSSHVADRKPTVLEEARRDHDSTSKTTQEKPTFDTYEPIAKAESLGDPKSVSRDRKPWWRKWIWIAGAATALLICLTIGGSLGAAILGSLAIAPAISQTKNPNNTQLSFSPTHSPIMVTHTVEPTPTATAIGFADEGRPVISIINAGSVTPLSIWNDFEDVNSIAFSPDGTILASGSSDNTVRLWHVSDGSFIRSLLGHSDSVKSVAFSPDGTILASGSEDATVKLWRVSDGTLIRTLEGFESGVNSVAFSPDGFTLATGADGIRLFQVSSAKLLTILDWINGSLCVAFSPNGERLVSVDGNGTIRLWQLNSRELKYTLWFMGGSFVIFSPNGSTFVSGNDFNNNNEYVHFFNLYDGSVIQSLKGTAGEIISGVFSPDGTIFATGSKDSEVQLWNSSNGTLLRSLSGHKNSVTSMAFSPNGRLLVSSSTDNTIRLWGAP